jgi:hypothetical protein
LARKRSIDPDIWSDDRFTELSISAGFLYLGLISIADDEGRIEWSPVQLRNRIFVGRASRAEVESWMVEIVALDLIRVYKIDAKSYGFHPSWHKHQFASHALESKLPDPPGVPKRYVRGEKSVVDSWKGNKPTRSLVNVSDMAGHGQPLPDVDEPRPAISEPGPDMAGTRPPQLVLDTYMDTETPNPPRGPGQADDPDLKTEPKESAAPSQRVPRALTEPFGFADWFFAEAFSLSLLGYHEPEARDTWVGRELRAAGDVLKNGVDESQIRARRYLLALQSGELTKFAPTVRGLLKAWDFGCVRSASKRQSANPEPRKFGSLRPEDRDGGSLGKSA